MKINGYLKYYLLFKRKFSLFNQQAVVKIIARYDKLVIFLVA